MNEGRTIFGAVPDRLYHMGIRSVVSRSTLADANEKRNWRIYADFAQVLILEARRLYAGDSFGVELEETVYALDSTTISLCLSLFPWGHVRRTKSAIKLHILLDLRGSIPSFLRITDARSSDVSLLDELVPEAGAIYVMDRGYVDFARLYNFTLAQASFVVRAKKNLRFKRRYSRAVDRSTGLLCDQTVVLVTARSADGYPEPLRRVRSRDPETGKAVTLLTNNFRLSAWEVAELYRCRWHVELFFNSSGSSSTYASRPSTAHPTTPSGLKSGSPSARTSSSQSSRSASTANSVSTQCYRS